MRKLFIYICVFFFLFGYSQKDKVFIFNVELSSDDEAPTFTKINGLLSYNGNNVAESNFYKDYTITNFYQTYPSSKVQKSLNMFTFQTLDESLMNDLLVNFSNKYLRIEDLTGQNLELLLYYPNDYGTTSPITNLGANISLKSFDYVNAPKAWDYFPSNSIGNVKIGISDGKVNNTDADLQGKVSYLFENQFNSNFSCGSESWHGVGVAAIAAAQGNNAHGITGVCSDCGILNVPYGSYQHLLVLANNGVKVINLSWINGYNYNDGSYNSGFFQSQQDIINEIHEMGVVLVAGAGNVSTYSNSTAPNYSLYCYPASYEHVISVTVVQAKNSNFSDEVVNYPFGNVSWYNEDLITPTGSYENGVYTPYWEGTTTNSRVDICGPGYAPLYSSFLLGCNDLYASATSAATPYVTGTVALMQSLNSCLLPDEIEDILQLSSKNIEANPYNFMYAGRLGSGKLETGDAVEFVYEAMKPVGNALIDGQDFWRFNFDLQHINNKLTISNQIFRDQNTSNFVAKNSIEVLEKSDFKPNNLGFVDLKINSDLVLCNNNLPKLSGNKEKKQDNFKENSSSSTIKLYPNPNNGSFLINIGDYKAIETSVIIFDIYGKQVYNSINKEQNIDVNIEYLQSGIYLVKINSSEFNEVIKFIKK